MAFHPNHDARHRIYTASPTFSIRSNRDGCDASCTSEKKKSPTRTSRLHPLASTETRQLSAATRLRWMEDANASYFASSLHLGTHESTNPLRSAEQALHEITHPVVALASELATSALTGHSLSPTTAWDSALKRDDNQMKQTLTITPILKTPGTQSSSPSRKLAPLAGASVSQPLYARPKAKTELLKARARVPNRIPIEPLLSEEMLMKLRSHLEEKIQGTIWQNEIRSRLARPLSATTFCDREEQLKHPLSAMQFIPPPGDTPWKPAPSSPGVNRIPPRFPFSVGAHQCTRQIAKCYSAMCFRVAILAQVRRLAIAIRVFRRAVIPKIAHWHRRRVAAAIAIQKRFRRHHRQLQWRKSVLLAQVAPLVHEWIDLAIRRVQAAILIVTNIEKLFVARKKRIRDAIRRHLQLLRWVTKTKVCLFVHRVWCIEWFRKKRHHNRQVMLDEVQVMEEIDLRIGSEYQILFKTSMGKKLAKKELETWRQHVKLTNTFTAANESGGAHVQEARTATTSSASTGEPSDFDASSLVRLRNCFNVFDIDGSGALDLDEFQLMVSYLRGAKDTTTTKKKKSGVSTTKLSTPTNLSTAQIRDLFDDLDVDGNERVTCEEFETWWRKQQDLSTSSSASSSFLSGGLDRIVLESHGSLFWLLGKKQQLERKFVKKNMVKRAQDLAKQSFLTQQMQQETTPPVRRCTSCGRRFELQRDLNEHRRSACSTSTQLIVDTFTLRKWIREEEIRLLDDDADA